MLKQKCPKCGQELGYKFSLKLYRRGYKCPKCKTNLQTTFNLTLTLFLTFFVSLSLSDYLVTFISLHQKYPQITEVIVSLITIIAVWMIISTIMPRTLKIAEKRK